MLRTTKSESISRLGEQAFTRVRGERSGAEVDVRANCERLGAQRLAQRMRETLRNH
jgi:hypothetical protein